MRRGHPLDPLYETSTAHSSAAAVRVTLFLASFAPLVLAGFIFSDILPLRNLNIALYTMYTCSSVCACVGDVGVVAVFLYISFFSLLGG